MDCEKENSLQATSDTEPILAESFMMEGQLTDLYLYSQELKILQKGKSRAIPIKFGLSFRINLGDNGKQEGLQLIYGQEKVTLSRDFWYRACQWEATLLKYLIRSDFHSFFKPIRKIGRGNFATVYLAEDLNKNRYSAIKAFMKEVAYKGEGFASIQNEIKVLRKLRHQNVVQLYGVYESKNSLYFSMEYVQGITLQAFLRKKQQLNFDQRRKILKGLLQGLKQLTRMKIVHRDIKPENIIVTQNCQIVKIIDFGLATHVDQPNYLFVRCGTPGYVAPEILKIRDVQKVRLGLQSDMFSLGAIYFRLIYGYPLFKGKDHAEVLTLNRQAKIRLAHKENVAFVELELLHNMLQNDPFCRITPQEALKNDIFMEKKDKFYKTLLSIQNEETNSWIIEGK